MACTAIYAFCELERSKSHLDRQQSEAEPGITLREVCWYAR